VFPHEPFTQRSGSPARRLWWLKVERKRTINEMPHDGIEVWYVKLVGGSDTESGTEYLDSGTQLRKIWTVAAKRTV